MPLERHYTIEQHSQVASKQPLVFAITTSTTAHRDQAREIAHGRIALHASRTMNLAWPVTLHRRRASPVPYPVVTWHAPRVDTGPLRTDSHEDGVVAEPEPSKPPIHLRNYWTPTCPLPGGATCRNPRGRAVQLQQYWCSTSASIRASLIGTHKSDGACHAETMATSPIRAWRSIARSTNEHHP